MDILVSGASIAGLSAAHWLARSGHRVTVVENAPGARRGGLAVDVRGDALQVAKDMGVHEAIVAARVPTADVYHFLDGDGVPQAVFEPSVEFYDSPDDVEISRDRLSDILQAAVPDGVAFVYGASVAALRDGPDAVEVTLSDGAVHRCDLVVGADGMHSTVRALAFGPEREFVHHLGLYVAIVKRCRTGRGLAGSHVYNAPGRMVALRGDGHDCSALLGFRSPPLDHDFRDVAAHRAIVRDAFAGEDAWRVPEIMAEVGDAEDFYFDAVAQVRMPGWSRGRVVLVGDAGYCASFFSGMGTSLAMLGAAALARALDAADDLPAALARYGAAMRPVVDEAHGMAEGGAAILFPPTWEAIEERNRRIGRPVRTG